MKQDLEAQLTHMVHDLFNQDVAIALTRPEEQFGDYSTNIALQLAGKLQRPATTVANTIIEKLRSSDNPNFKAVSVAGPGFINFTVADSLLAQSARQAIHQLPQTLTDQSVVVEYSDPNPFKVLHAGHLYTSIIGDAIANLLEQAGGNVHRVNFGGDVGLHVAKTLWAVLTKTTNGHIDQANTAWQAVQELAKKPLAERASWLAERYIEGTAAFESKHEEITSAVTTLNTQLYEVISSHDTSSDLANIYWTTRQWSYDYFDGFYASIGSHFDKYYPESETAEIGLTKAKELLKSGTLVESDGAVVFKGEDHGLHTRVFINSQGLPTYETKDLGLQLAKWNDYHFNRSIIITGNDIIEYMKVVLAVVDQFAPELAQATTHLTHGMVKLEGGQKMSSRKGNILEAKEVIAATEQANRKLIGNDNADTTLGAIKFAFLKQRMGGDIIFNPLESVSLEGNSGPYLQYAYARARSILAKLETDHSTKEQITELQPSERSLARKVSEFPEIVERATNELMPHHVANYLYELAQTFNRFYEKSRVIGDPRQVLRSQLLRSYAEVLGAGLKLLNIETPEHL